MIIAISNTKGGVGKTTMALLLAGEFALKQKICLIDADPRSPLTSWSTLPGCPENIHVLTSGGEKTILDEMDQAKRRFDIIIIDLEGIASRLVSYAMSRADIVLIPTQEQHQDAAAALDVIEEIKRDMSALGRVIPYYIVFSRTRVVAKSRTARHVANDLLSRGDIPIFNTEINERDAFSALFSIGGTLHQLSEDDVNNLDAAKMNAAAFAAEVARTTAIDN